MPDDEGLKKLYQRATRCAAQDGCPDAERIRLLAAGELSRADRLQLVDHLTVCSDCSNEYRAAVAVGGWVGEIERDLRPAAVVVRPHWRWVAVAATIVVAVGIPAWIALDDGGERSPAFRTVVRPADTAVTPSDRARLEQAPNRLEWAARDGAAYRVELYDAESSLIWRSERVETAAVELPQTVRDRIGPGELYYWRVFIELEGERIQSALHQFEITR